MKKTQVALAALALVASSAAMADGVTLYGSADASVITGGSTTSFDGGGGYTTSLFGIRGSEDLGGGLKASFNLESGVNLANGGIGGGGGGMAGLFNRAANVSLGNEAIGITLGNQISIVVGDSFTGATAGAGDNVNVPAVIRLLGGTPGSVVHAGGSLSTTTGRTSSGFFIADAVTLRASGAGLTFKIQSRTNSTSSTNSGYTAFTLSGSAGGVNLAAGQQKSSGFVATGQADDYTTTFVAGNTKIGDIGVNAAFARNSGLVDASTAIIGASYSISEAFGVGALYARGTAATGNQTSINARYSLSKSTVVYATVSQFTLAGAGGVFSNTGNGGIGATAKSVTSVGVSHSF